MRTNTVEKKHAQLLAEVKHFARETMSLRFSPRHNLRREMLESICSRLKQLNHLFFQLEEDNFHAYEAPHYFKYLSNGLVEQVWAPNNKRESPERPYGYVKVVPLLEYAKAGTGPGNFPGTPFEGRITLFLSALAMDETRLSSLEEYMDGIRSVWRKEGGVQL